MFHEFKRKKFFPSVSLITPLEGLERRKGRELIVFLTSSCTVSTYNLKLTRHLIQHVLRVFNKKYEDRNVENCNLLYSSYYFLLFFIL